MTDKKPQGRAFPVTTNFQREARKPGGLSLSEALERAEKNLDQMRDQFPTILAEKVGEMNRIIAAARDADPEWRDRLKLSCGDLSDAATTLGYGLVAFVASRLRNACDTLTTSQTDKIVALHIAAMRQYGAEQFHNSRLTDLPRLEAALAEEMRQP